MHFAVPFYSTHLSALRISCRHMEVQVRGVAISAPFYLSCSPLPVTSSNFLLTVSFELDWISDSFLHDRGVTSSFEDRA